MVHKLMGRSCHSLMTIRSFGYSKNLDEAKVETVVLARKVIMIEYKNLNDIDYIFSLSVFS